MGGIKFTIFLLSQFSNTANIRNDAEQWFGINQLHLLYLMIEYSLLKNYEMFLFIEGVS